MKKRFLTLLMVIAMLFSETAPAYGTELNANRAGKKPEIEIPPLTYQSDGTHQVNSIGEMGTLYSSLPGRYESPHVTSVKSQGKYGVCHTCL